jgi:hypothetical protein
VKRSSCIFRAGRLTRDDRLAQRNHSLRGRHHEQHRLPLFLVQLSDVLVDALEVRFMSFPQLLAGDRVVIYLGRFLVSSLVNVPAQPDGLHDNADVLVVLQGQLGEVFDPGVGEVDWRKSKHIHLPGLECFLGLVLLVANVPVLDDL